MRIYIIVFFRTVIDKAGFGLLDIAKNLKDARGNKNESEVSFVSYPSIIIFRF